MKTILELDNLYFSYPGQETLALNAATLSVPAVSKIAVVGRNGSGKSTLFLHCNGILRPHKGTVRFCGQPVAYDRVSLTELRRRVGIVFQNADDQLFSASVAQDISFGPLNLGLSERETRQRVQAAAEMCEIADLLDRPTHALSGGQKTRAALAGVLAMDPMILIADEVSGNLDPWMRVQLLAIFHHLVAEGKTVLLATNDMDIARHWADLVVVMDAGRVIAAAPPDEVFADPVLADSIGPHDLWSALQTEIQRDGRSQNPGRRLHCTFGKDYL